MAVLNVEIGRRTFQIACDDGQEEHLKGLAAGVSERIEELSQVLPDSTNETMLLAMATIMMQDEINELREKGPSAVPAKGIAQKEVDKQIDAAVAEAIDAVSDYVEAVTIRIKAA